MPTANPYYTNTFSGQAGQTARAESVDTECAGIAAGFDAVYTAIQRALLASAGEVLNPLPAAASRANKFLKFGADGQPLVVNGSLNWRGYWAPSTLYLVGDIIQIGPRMNFMYCATQHTSGASYAGTNWSLFLDLSGVQWWQYRIVNSTGVAAVVPGDSVFLDSSAGPITVQLPTGVLGDSPINLTVIGGSLSTGHEITIQSAAGQYLMGATETTLAVDVANASMALAYSDAAHGWRLRTMG